MNNILKQNRIVIDPFCYKQFDKNSKSTYIETTQKELLEKLNNYCSENPENILKPGYAPFCKHIFLPNFTSTKIGYHKITPQNRHLLISEYEARTEKELPVLTRYFPKESVDPIKAEFLDIILYSRDQIEKENAAMGNENINNDYDWGVISIKPQNENFELQMDPITMMRNALGVEYGGSGVPLEKEKYLNSVKFWAEFARIR